MTQGLKIAHALFARTFCDEESAVTVQLGRIIFQSTKMLRKGWALMRNGLETKDHPGQIGNKLALYYL